MRIEIREVDHDIRSCDARETGEAAACDLTGMGVVITIGSGRSIRLCGQHMSQLLTGLEWPWKRFLGHDPYALEMHDRRRR